MSAAGTRAVSRPGVLLLDIGGVLAVDPWETLLLTPEVGLGARLGVPVDDLREIGVRLWQEFSTHPAVEGDYWQALASELGTDVPAPLVREVEDALLLVNEGWGSARCRLRDAGIRTGIVSDNTSFWFAKQVEQLALDDVVDPALVFVSFELGHSKKEVPGLFDIAASVVAAEGALVVDDRDHNLERAAALGFAVTRYSMHDDPGGLAAALSPLWEDP